MTTYYYDYCGTYSIKVHRDGSATLRCRNAVAGTLDLNQKYKSEKGAKIALARYCGGMPTKRG